MDLFDKITSTGIATAHAFLDRVRGTDFLSGATLDQGLREFTEARRGIEAELNGARHDVTVAEGRVTTLKKQIGEKQKSIELMVRQGKDETAKTLIKEKQALEGQLKDAEEAVSKAKAGVTKREQTVAAINEQERVFKATVSKAKADQGSAKADSKMARALENAADMSNGGELDAAAAKAGRSSAVAAGRLDRAMSEFTGTSDTDKAVSDATAEDELAKLKASMKQPQV